MKTQKESIHTEEIEDLTEEIKFFLEDCPLELNEHGTPIYISSNGNDSINLKLYLLLFQNFLDDLKNDLSLKIQFEEYKNEKTNQKI